MKDYKLIAFDLDWTIRGTISGKTFPEHVSDWQILPGRLEKIKELQKADKNIAVCTNQGGLLWREATGGDKYPTPIMLAESLKPFIMQLSWQSATKQDPWYVSLYDQRAVDLINKDADPYKAQEILTRLQNELFEALQRFNVRISIDPSWRKPEPRMIQHAIQLFEAELEETLFVGDRAEDEKAARAAGCDFIWGHEFFGDDNA